MIGCCITKNIKDVAYENLLKYSLEKSDAFMLVYFSYKPDERMKKIARKIHDGLRTYKIKKRYNPIWPNTRSLNQFEHQYKIVFYRAEPASLDYLLLCSGLLDWEYPSYPMDLCFFKDGYCWFYTTPHEEYGYIYLEDENEMKILENLGVEFEYYDKLDNPDLFYEDYTV